MQSFMIVANPALLIGSQFVPDRFDLDQHEFPFRINEEIGPSRIPAPVVFDEIVKDFHEGVRRHEVDQLSGNLNVLSPMRPQIIP